MLKRIVDKKIDAFKECFPDYQTSKKLSLYTRVGVQKSKMQTKVTGRAVTKGTIGKIGQVQEWEKQTARFVYLISPKGKLMISRSGSNFKNVSLKDIRQENADLVPVFFIGRKYEWMKDYPNLFNFKFFQGFNSLAEAKKFLGFSFISDEDFVSMFGEGWYDYLTPMILAKEKSNVVRLYKNLNKEVQDILSDYVNMCQEHKIEIEIPAGVNRLEELHDKAMWEVNKKNMDNYSKEMKFDIQEEFTKEWEKRGLSFRRLSTPYEMYAQGIKQQHCIGTNYANSLGRFAFYSFNYKDRSYEIQLSSDGSVYQFYGRKNTSPPQELKEKIKKDINLKFTLKDIQPDLKNYPMLNKETVVDDGWFIA